MTVRVIWLFVCRMIILLKWTLGTRFHSTVWYKGKVQPGELEAKYTAEQIADMQRFCDAKFAAFKKLYDISNRISN